MCISPGRVWQIGRYPHPLPRWPVNNTHCFGVAIDSPFPHVQSGNPPNRDRRQRYKQMADRCQLWRQRCCPEYACGVGPAASPAPPHLDREGRRTHCRGRAFCRTSARVYERQSCKMPDGLELDCCSAASRQNTSREEEAETLLPVAFPQGRQHLICAGSSPSRGALLQLG